MIPLSVIQINEKLLWITNWRITTGKMKCKEKNRFKVALLIDFRGGRIFLRKIMKITIPKLLQNSSIQNWNLKIIIHERNYTRLKIIYSISPTFPCAKLGEARVYIFHSRDPFQPHFSPTPLRGRGGVYWKSWSPDQFPRDSSPCINGIATIPLSLSLSLSLSLGV